MQRPKLVSLHGLTLIASPQTKNLGLRPHKVICPYCRRAAELVDGSVIYPHRSDIKHLLFYHCAPCDAYVGCHPPADENGRGGVGTGTTPLGRLANAQLRTLKRAALDVFNPFCKRRRLNKAACYKWLSVQLGLPKKQTYIAKLNEAQCRRVVTLVTAWDKLQA